MAISFAEYNLCIKEITRVKGVMFVGVDIINATLINACDIMIHYSILRFFPFWDLLFDAHTLSRYGVS